MAESEVSVRFTSKEEAKLWQSFVKLSSSFGKVREDAAGAKKATDDVDASLKKFAQNEVRMNARGLESGLAKFAQLDAALKANLITQEQHATATARHQEALRREWAKAAPEPIEMKSVVDPNVPTEEMKKFAERVKAINATPIERLNVQLAKHRELLRAGLLDQEQFRRASVTAHNDYQRELEESAKKQKQLAAGASIAATETGLSFSSMLSSAGLSVAGGIALVGKLWAKMRDEAKGAADEITSTYKSLGKLGQIGDAKQTAERSKMAEEYYASGAVGTREEANQTILELANAGALEDRKVFADLQKVGLIDSPTDIATKAQQLRTTLGEKEAGSFPLIIARAFAAAQPVNTTPDKLLAAAAKSGESAGTLGIAAPDLLAATTTMIRAKGIEEGGSRLASLLAKLPTLEGVEGTGLFDRLESIKQKNLDPAKLKEFLGDATAVEAFGILTKNRDETQSLSRDVAQANTGILDRKVADQMAVTDVGDAVRAAQSLAVDTLAKRDIGRRTLKADTAQRQGVGRIRQKYGEFAGAAADMAATTARFVPGADEQLVGDVERGTRSAPSIPLTAAAMNPIIGLNLKLLELLDKMVDGQSKTTAAAEKLDKAADKLGSVRGAQSPRFNWPAAARADAAAEAK